MCTKEELALPLRPPPRNARAAKESSLLRDLSHSQNPNLRGAQFWAGLRYSDNCYAQKMSSFVQ